MRENQKQMNLNAVNNKSFSYLKYTDPMNNKTILFHLDKDSVCNSIQIICDKSSETSMINEYNSLYENAGRNMWIDNSNMKKARIELTKGEYSSVVLIKPEK